MTQPKKLTLSEVNRTLAPVDGLESAISTLIDSTGISEPLRTQAIRACMDYAVPDLKASGFTDQMIIDKLKQGI